MSPHPAWTQDEDALLRRACECGGTPAAQVARELGRARADVRRRVRELDLTWARVGTGLRWTPDEDEVVRAGVRAGLRPVDIAAQLPRRSPAAVAVRIHALGQAVHGRRWTPVDDYRLRLAVEAGDAMDRIAADLERTRESIRHRCRDLGVGKPRPARDGRAYRAWTPAEEARLLELRDLPLADVARRLGRSEAVVRRRLLRLNAAQPRTGRFVPQPLGGFSHGEDRLILERVQAGSALGSLARRLGRSLAEVEARARSLTGGLEILIASGAPAQYAPSGRRERARA